MKRILLLCMIGIGMSGINHAETTFDKGKVSGKIYAGAYSNLTGDFNSSSRAFEVTRAYFGYENRFADNFTAFVKLDIGSVDDDSEYALIRRYTYFKNAGIKYKNSGWEFQFGLIGTYQFKLQEKFWGKRYLRKSFQDEFKWNPSADLGLFAKRKLNDLFEVDVMISNGEGYKNFQYDDFLRYSAGVVAKPGNFEFRAGADFTPTDINTNSAYCAYAGYRGSKFRIGGDVNVEYNFKNNPDHTRYGYSVYSDVYLSEKLSIYGRYDWISSNILEGDERPWNLGKDGSALVAGFEYFFNNYFTLSLNYQDWMPYAGNLDYASAVYLNMEINF